MSDFNMRPVYFGDIDIVFDEKGSQFLTMRKTQWVKEGNEPDEEKAKYEIRKYSINNDGEEVVGKGVSFLTPEGPDNMIHELVKNGYGDTIEVLKNLMMRDNFAAAVESVNIDSDDSVSGEDAHHFFDMKTLLMNTIEDTEVEEAS